MLAINQFDLEPGPYEHYKEVDGKKNIYILKNIVTHRKNREGVWEKLQDPEVIYEPLEAQYESINGGPTKMVHVCYSNTYSHFTEMVTPEIRRFTPMKIEKFGTDGK